MATDRETGFYCSTSGTYFSDKESLAEHYKSDFHRYNLKRKVCSAAPAAGPAAASAWDTVSGVAAAAVAAVPPCMGLACSACMLLLAYAIVLAWKQLSEHGMHAQPHKCICMVSMCRACMVCISCFRPLVVWGGAC
jgi:hypothetical protein